MSEGLVLQWVSSFTDLPLMESKQALPDLPASMPIILNVHSYRYLAVYGDV
jgi:hypothetical protein